MAPAAGLSWQLPAEPEGENLHAPSLYPANGERLLLPKCQVSPPRKMIESPAFIEVEAQVEVQVDMPGACSHGELWLVPLLESEPFAAM